MTDFCSKRLNRRTFLKTGSGGIAALCAASVSGCRRGESAQNMSDSMIAQKGFVSARPSAWFTQTGNGKITCQLCPKSCRLEKGDRGPCRVRENRDGTGYTLAYGNPALVQDDPIERKPFFHVRPGIRVLSLATAGCNLACKFCEVWDMAQVGPEDVHAYDMPPDTVVAHAVSSNVPAISYAFGEPVIFYEYMTDVAAAAKQAGLLNLIHTAGYIQPEPLDKLCGLIDAANIDLKSFDPSFYREIVGGSLDPVLSTLKQLRHSGVHIEITYIVIPTLNDDMKKIGQMCQWLVDELGQDVPIHFSRFYPLYKLSSLPRTPVSTLNNARETALKAGLNFVYIARVTGHEAENTFCPGCKKTVIKRVGFVVDENHIKDGKCAWCQRGIPGRWQ